MAFSGLGTSEIILLAAQLTLMVYCLIRIMRSRFRNNTTRLLWVLVVLFAPLLGSLLFFWYGRDQRVIRKSF